MAQRQDDAAEVDHVDDHNEESSFVATAREVIARRETLLDALDE
ncbi:MAG: hypothetical protein ABEH56_07100 [Salinirussus sp.]